MSEDKTRTTILADAQEEDLDFTVVQKNPKIEVPNAAGKPTTTVAKVAPKKVESLKLENENYNAKASRGELYKELKKAEQQIETDVYDYPTPVSRAAALLIDSAFTVGLVKASIITAPLEIQLVDLFISKYNLQMDIPVEYQIPVFMALTIFLALFFFIVIPTAFFNATLGKKLTGLRVRGVDKYTLSIGQVFWRELLYKPLSIGLLVGFVLPFFNEQKQSLHDKISGTFVIKD